MGNHHSPFTLSCTFFFLFNGLSLCLGAAVHLNFTTDKHALFSFKNFITSDPDDILRTKWSENTSVCNWIGVKCGIKHQRVTALNLSGFDLAGTVAPHLGNLTFLRYLDISSNNFTGFLPMELSGLRRLKVMNVGLNSFTGVFPTWLGGLPEVEQLYLHNNSFSGIIPPSLFNSSKLQILRMSSNMLSGNIPKEIGNSYSIMDLRISYNDLQGEIPPEIGNLSRLEILSMDNGFLSGNIPSSIFNISSLRSLGLANNSLSGWLPRDICRNMLNIKELYLGRNRLEGQIPPTLWKYCKNLEILSLDHNTLSGSIPREIGNMSMLRELRLQHNELNGELPQEIGNLPILHRFSVLSNDLTGSIPSSIFNLSTLKVLELSFNEFSGVLPSSFGDSLFNLEWLLLAQNGLNGPIPNSITNASKLYVLDMELNSFSGPIPNFGNLRLLQELRLWRNNLTSGAASPTQESKFLSSLTNCRYLNKLQFGDNPLLNGMLPASIGNLSSSLQHISAQDCKFSGVIPSEIGNLSSLLNLFLGGNQLSGPIPPTVGKMKRLQRLYLDRNQLVGSIPNNLCRLNNLGELNLSSNMLVGPIPECLGEVTSLRDLELGSNHLNSTIPPNLWTLRDLSILNLTSNYLTGQLPFQLGNLKTINTLDLSFNQFTGEIPNLIDGCQSLEFLHLSNNLISGFIPQSLGNIKGLQTLDLSYNNLSGSIPKSLEDLHFLQLFNVSNNKLQGGIPDRGPFANFTAQSFTHNFALCGSTRFQVQPCPKIDGGSRLKKVVRLIKYLVPSLIVLAFITVIALLVLIRRRKQKSTTISTDISPRIEWRRISHIELERGTSSFSETNLLGRGSYGSVFEATLSDGLKVAVKVFNLQLQGTTRSFDTETTIMGSIRHRNLVPVIGCCSNTEFKALILTYMPNGSLDKWLYSEDNNLDLMQRLKVAIDVAAALEYLHHGYSFPVVHCDLKPSNVLLDEDMVAHLSDFGISKLFEGGEAFIQTQTLATIGYASPELGTEGIVSTKGDVYSFGIMMLEMFTGKKPTDDMFDEEMCLRDWVIEAEEENAVVEITAPALLSREDRHFSAKEQCVSSIFQLAIRCVAISANERINMTEAAAVLHKIKATITAATERRRRRS